MSSVGEYFAISHAGHGVNSYALSYRLVSGPLAVFVQNGFGGAYGDRDADGAAISGQFALIQQLLDVVEAKDLATDEYPGRLVAVENPLRGLMISEWLAGPIGDTAAAGDCLREADRKDGRVFWIEGESEPPMMGGALQAAIDAIESFDVGR